MSITFAGMTNILSAREACHNYPRSFYYDIVLVLQPIVIRCIPVIMAIWVQIFQINRCTCLYLGNG